MAADDLRIARAAEGDLDELLALLTGTGLPHEGVREHLEGFFVARDGAGPLVGVVGIERHGPVGLLRSVAVSPSVRRSGLGSRLTAIALEEAARSGLEEIVLLTTTARDFFVDRFGFREAVRSDYDARLEASPEWNLPRCSSAAFLRLELPGRGYADR